MKRYVLLTPGPLTTSNTVKSSMLQDMGTRDKDYQDIVEKLRYDLLYIAQAEPEKYTCVLLQGSGTYGVESVLTSTIRKNEKVLLLVNGSYGERMEQICQKADIPYRKATYSMLDELPLDEIEKEISQADITHVAYIHCETTAGVLNNIQEIQKLIHKHHKISIVDAMSSFASIELSVNSLGIDYLITSSNKCLHGVPGIAIIFAKKDLLDKCVGICHSVSLDLYEQYHFMEQTPGSFRFTSPTHVLLALQEAIQELLKEGGVSARYKRYRFVQEQLHQAMIAHGFETLIDAFVQSPVITTFLNPEGFDFNAFYDYFKQNGFLLYSGKLPNINAFRIGNIGVISDEDVEKFITLLDNYKECPSCK